MRNYFKIYLESFIIHFANRKTIRYQQSAVFCQPQEPHVAVGGPEDTGQGDGAARGLGDPLHRQGPALLYQPQVQDNHFWRSTVGCLIFIWLKKNARALSLNFCLIFSGKLVYERDFRWKIFKFKYLCHVREKKKITNFSKLNFLKFKFLSLYFWRQTHSRDTLKYKCHAQIYLRTRTLK